MHEFVRNLITEWRRLDIPMSDAAVVVGVSGGADSVSLLLALYELQQRQKLDLRIIAAHFNHSLRGAESDADEEFVRQLTSRFEIELATARGSIAHERNVEQKARIARYDFLEKTARRLKAGMVLTGHTINDQAETFLMNLLRGSGAEGLSGIKPVRDLQPSAPTNPLPGTLPLKDAPIQLVRPLLTWAKRADTEAYCHAMEIDYRFDTMNEDTAFKRVRIRKILLPLLQDFNPNILETLASTAALMQEMTENMPAENRFAAADELILGEIKTVPRSAIPRLIRDWLRKRRGSTRGLELKHIEGIERLMFSTKSGSVAEVAGGKVIKTGGRLIYKANKVE